MTCAVTGDTRTDALVPHAARLVAAVHKFDRDVITEVLAEANDPHGLAVVLAAMVPDDATPTQLLGWIGDPDEYERLRDAGVSTVAACDVIAGQRKRRNAA